MRIPFGVIHSVLQEIEVTQTAIPNTNVGGVNAEA